MRSPAFPRRAGVHSPHVHFDSGCLQSAHVSSRGLPQQDPGFFEEEPQDGHRYAIQGAYIVNGDEATFTPR